MLKTLCTNLLLLSLVALLVPSMTSAQSVSFTQDTYSIPQILARADLNNDGREDFITVGGSSQFAVVLSSGDGVYQAPVYYNVPGGAVSVAVGQFNQAGRMDLEVSNGTTILYGFLNDGNGNFRPLPNQAVPDPITSLVAGDFNNDGKIDLVFLCSTTQSRYLLVWFGAGSGGFQVGPITQNVGPVGQLYVGDFDGDGKADIYNEEYNYGSTNEVFYGDGKGNFPSTASFVDNVAYTPFDLNSDGRMDLVGAPFDFSLNGSKYYNTVKVLYGNANRSFSASQIGLANCTNGGGVLVADLNGDGINDLVLTEASDCKNSPPYSVDVLLGKSGGTFQPEQPIYSTSAIVGADFILRANRDSKPDFSIATTPQGGTNSQETFFTNTTPGGFPSCSPPNSSTGITLCAPTSTTGESSSATFRIGAANQTPGRKLEVWIDGKKMGEQLKHAFSHYTFLDGTYNLSAGQHNVTVYSAGWDNLLQRLDFPLTVGSAVCPTPLSPGVNVCSPINNSTITGVQVQASGKVTGTVARMEVWVDGVKKFSTYGITTLNTNLALSQGPHRFDFYIVNPAGAKWKATRYATVQ